MSPDRATTINIEESHTPPVYHRRGLVAARGRGSLLWDVDGKEYIDCMAGFGASIVGHAHPKVVKAIIDQSQLLTACHSSLYNESRAGLIDRLLKVVPTSLDRIFLSNSGAEAVECALKVARRFTGKPGVVAMMRSFHGKTFGALSVTFNAKYRTPFQPLLEKVEFVPFGRIDKVAAAIGPETGAVIVEPVQGEGGVHVAPDGYLKELRDLTKDKKVLLILDEIQTGMARTGRMFAFEHWGVVPDLLCLGKALGSGLPISATLGSEEVMASLKMGEHSTTFGGNPLSCAAASATLETILEERLWERAALLGGVLREGLEGLKDQLSVVREVRGLGLMVGVEMRFDVLNIMNRLFERGVVILNAGVNVLRFLPPAVITETQIKTVVERLGSCLAEEQSERPRNRPS